MAINLEGIVTWLRGWFYEKGEVNTLLNAKVNQNQGQANYNVVTDSNGNITVEEKPVIPDVSGKIDTAGTGLSKSGTTLNHSNSVTAQTSAVAKKIKYDGQGHITGTSTLYGSDIAVSSSDSTKINTALGNKANSTHTHSATDVTDSNAHSHIGTSENATQGAINTAIDSVIGSLSSIRAIEVVTTLPTASSSTLGKLYIISENSKVNVYYTEQSGSSYSWHKMDTDILDELSVTWSDITSNPFNSYSPSDFATDDHSHGDISALGTFTGSLTSLLSQDTSEEDNGLLYVDGDSTEIKNAQYINANFIKDTVAHSNIGSSENATQDSINSSINTALSNKAPKSHSSSATTYGVGTTSNYGHNKVINDLNHNSFGNGESLSAYQGYVLRNAINGKQDEITSIVLVPKSTDANGKIIFYTGDEPT